MTASESRPAPAEVLPHLRRATASAHREIEALLQLDRIRSRAELAAVLQVFDAFLRDWEPRIGALLPEPMRDWFERHRRGPWACGDLRALGAGRLAAPPLDDLALGSAAAALGSLYVLEGSALGGRIIARRLHENLDVTEGNGGRFFGGRGEHTPRVWREFSAQLEAQIDGDATAIEQACRAAERTFRALTERFRERLAG